MVYHYHDQPALETLSCRLCSFSSVSFPKKSLTNHSPLPKKPRLNFRILLNIRAYLLTHQGQHREKGPLPDPRTEGTHI